MGKGFVSTSCCWSNNDVLDAGDKRLAGDIVREATAFDAELEVLRKRKSRTLRMSCRTHQADLSA